MRFTVASLPEADDELAKIWLKAADQNAVQDASDWIELQLKNDPLKKVTPVDDVYFVRRDPLVALCRISVDDRLVTIIEIHRAD
jgi:hypothetical protein